jgi:hypothetical protein
MVRSDSFKENKTEASRHGRKLLKREREREREREICTH